MKTCKIGWPARIITLAVFALLFVPVTVLFACLLLTDQSAPARQRRMYLLGVLLFGGVTAFAAYRALYLDPVWAEYDENRVIFHPTRREAYEFSWQDIPGPLVQAASWQGGYAFLIETGARQRKVPLNRLFHNWRDFEKTMEAAGVLHRLGITTQADFRQRAEDIFSQFDAYREAHPNSVRPKPEDAVPCPACAGRGIFPKRLPVLNVEVGKVCKTCGGSGYIEKTT